GKQDVVRLDMGQPERSDAGRVDDPSAEAQRQSHRLRRRMSAFPYSRYIAGGPIGLWYKTINERGLADTGMAEKHRHLVSQQRGDDVEWVVAARDGDREVEVGELLGERFRTGEISFGQKQDRLRPPRAVGRAGAPL